MRVIYCILTGTSTYPASGKGHSTEPSVHKFVSDIPLSADLGEVILFSILDLSASFDTVGYDVLLVAASQLKILRSLLNVTGRLVAL